MAECDVSVLFVLARGKLRLEVGDVSVYRDARTFSSVAEVIDGKVSKIHSATEKACGLAVKKAVGRIFANLAFDLDSCSCSPGDPCPAHELKAALQLARKR